ncbi:M48 family metalloprotease [Streptomyces sp. NPDC002516]
MLISVYVPLVVTAVLTVLAPPVARLLAPRPAVRALACAASVTTVGWMGSMALLAFTGVAQIPEVAEAGRWSVPTLRAEDPVHLTVAVVSALVLTAQLVALGRAAVRRTRQILWARRECAAMTGDSELSVIDDDRPQAFALPGSPGRIVVSRGMLQCLAPAEREALLAHERAHLLHRHHHFQTLWHLTAAANPLLRPLAAAGGFALERWADEDAAARVGDRAVVARAVGRAALAAAARPSGTTGALAATGGAVPQRVRALLAPPPPRRVLPIAAGALLLLLCCAGLANAAADSDELLDDAQRAQCRVVAPHPAGTHCACHDGRP